MIIAQAIFDVIVACVVIVLMYQFLFLGDQ
jgi:hypothetical protein